MGGERGIGGVGRKSHMNAGFDRRESLLRIGGMKGSKNKAGGRCTVRRAG